MDETAWDTVERLAGWLDRNSELPEQTRTILQILKITEEAGEVAEAVIGATGQNPRKGYSHTWDDVQEELCDVIVTAMVALTRINPDARKLFAGKLERIALRSLGDGPIPGPDPGQGANPDADAE
ncbi:MazG-like family protein [Streptacidiphilus cavernicola]|uniref:MazG-like family protein n=1 Tax=Streptacidiphilus cavernicola TaxID=3342716 RepID=A0ABV6W2L5_9ACTN